MFLAQRSSARCPFASNIPIIVPADPATRCRSPQSVTLGPRSAPKCPTRDHVLNNRFQSKLCGRLRCFGEMLPHGKQKACIGYGYLHVPVDPIRAQLLIQLQD